MPRLFKIEIKSSVDAAKRDKILSALLGAGVTLEDIGITDDGHVVNMVGEGGMVAVRGSSAPWFYHAGAVADEATFREIMARYLEDSRREMGVT